MISYFHSLWNYRHLVAHKAWADFRAESQRTYLGVVWWVLDPIINTAIYYLVFGIFFNRGGEDFVPFLIIGIVGWNWFQGGIIAGSVSIWRNAPTIQQVAFPKSIFPCTQMLVATYKFSFSLLVLFCALLLFGYYPNAYWIFALGPLAVQLVLIIAFGTILGAVVPFFPDLASLIPYTLRLGFFMSCVIYKLEDISEKAQFYLKMNPMVHVLNAYRDALMYHRMPDALTLGIIGAVGLLGALCGFGLIARFDSIYAKRIIR